MIARFILQQTRDGDRLLSIGCGNGYVEFLLSQHARNVIAIEPSVQATQLLRSTAAPVRIYAGYFPRVPPAEEGPFALGYAVATEYVFDNRELRGFLFSIRERGIPSFLLVSASVHKDSLVRAVRRIGKALLGRLRLRSLGQFWGYERTPAELLRVFRQSGYSRIAKGELGEYFWIRGEMA